MNGIAEALSGAMGRHPDERAGQLIFNALYKAGYGWRTNDPGYPPQTAIDPFYLSNEAFIKALKEY